MTPQISLVDLWWLALLPLAIGSFVLLRRAPRTGAFVAVLGLVAIAWGWAVFYAWMHFTFDHPFEARPFDSVEYLKREAPSGWRWRFLATTQGWIPGVIIFAIAWAAARRWPRRRA
jgi:hypothetical protein